MGLKNVFVFYFNLILFKNQILEFCQFLLIADSMTSFSAFFGCETSSIILLGRNQEK